MAIVIKALILCSTDSPEAALQGAFSALNGGAFESANPIIDFAIGVEQAVQVSPGYQDGDFVSQIEGGCLLTTVDALALPH